MYFQKPKANISHWGKLVNTSHSDIRKENIKLNLQMAQLSTQKINPREYKGKVLRTSKQVGK